MQRRIVLYASFAFANYFPPRALQEFFEIRAQLPVRENNPERRR